MTAPLSSAAPDRVRTDVLILPLAAGEAESDAAVRALDRRHGGRLLAEIRRARFRGDQTQELSYQTHDDSGPGLIVLLGIGAAPTLGVWYDVADAAVRHSAAARAPRVGVVLGKHANAATTHAVVEGVALASYRFDRYRSRPVARTIPSVTVIVPRRDAALERSAAAAAVYARATALARDLANTPAADLAPLDLASAAQRLAPAGLRVRVHDRRALERHGMEAILAVGRGSQQPPCLIEISYRPRRPARRRIALVGKGITFDSGGLSIKNADSMQMQKRDMAGGAVVLAALSALPALDLPIEVHGYVPAAENMPSGTALRPGDVLRVCSGTTVEVLNTDAEGRLVLADALAYAVRRRPDVILDFATLTAAVRAALGPRCAAVMGTDRHLVATLLAAAADANEMLWELPLIGEYRRDLDSRVADLKNIGDGPAGTITAALFLREFVGDVPWAHVDFSSTVMSDGFACHPKGASGYGVRTLLHALTRLAEQEPK